MWGATAAGDEAAARINSSPSLRRAFAKPVFGAPKA
jgi:hypothetical protein